MVMPKGFKQSKETCEKRNRTLKRLYKEGKHKGGFKRGYTPWNKGKHGGKYIKLGYVMVYNPNHPNHNSTGYVFEHRLIIEKKIGRYLTKDEIVHHKNKIRNDNRLENLEIMSPSEHRKHTVMDYYNLIEKERVKDAIESNITERICGTDWANEWRKNLLEELELI